MVLEDFGGQSLAQIELAGQLDLIDFLKLAIEITEILGQVHQRQIMHKDINPANIVAVPPQAILDLPSPLLDSDEQSKI